MKSRLIGALFGRAGDEHVVIDIRRERKRRRGDDI
jgi:hypothetical protein